MKDLKPVVFSTSQFNYYRNNVFQQNMLLKAMQTTLNPDELKKMVGLKTVADVYRTLDKLSIRKEYHEALVRQGITLDIIVSGIKEIAESAVKSGDRLKAYQTLLRSLGLDRYEKQEDSGKSWEEVLLKITDGENSKELKTEENLKIEKKVEYEVVVPKPPAEELEKEEIEKELAKQLYEG